MSSSVPLQEKARLALRRGYYSFELLLEQRLGLFLWADGFLIVAGLMGALLSDTGFDQLLPRMIVFPTLCLMVPVLANLVAVERRSGSLDLALAVPSTEAYFLRRVVPVTLFFILQNYFLLHVGMLLQRVWLDTMSHPFQMLRIHFYIAELCVLVSCIGLFWASRLGSAGGVMVGSAVTLVVLWPWLSPDLSTGATQGSMDRLLGIPYVVWKSAWDMAVLLLAAAIFYLYARGRLRRPEKMLT